MWFIVKADAVDLCGTWITIKIEAETEEEAITNVCQELEDHIRVEMLDEDDCETVGVDDVEDIDITVTAEEYNQSEHGDINWFKTIDEI